MLKIFLRIPFLLFIPAMITYSCVTEFVPEVSEEKELLVVEGLITDQHEINTIRLSRSLPLGLQSEMRPVSGYVVSISDDGGNQYGLTDLGDGRYITDSTVFRGQVGRIYTLKINTNSRSNNLTYESIPVKMQPVPPVDSLYYERTATEDGSETCLILLNSKDPQNNCKYFRWNYTETWLIRLNFSIPNKICWVTENSHHIDIKTTLNLNQSDISRHPITYITKNTDRLLNEYSIVVDQYSLTEDEFIFWDKVQKLVEEGGGLYDVVPSSIPSNLNCIDNPAEKVLGYFSVSAKSSKRIFIREGEFKDVFDPYANCITGLIYSSNPPGLNESVWILLSNLCSFPCFPTYVITTHYECTDCTLRGSTHRPSFWIDY